MPRLSKTLLGSISLLAVALPSGSIAQAIPPDLPPPTPSSAPRVSQPVPDSQAQPQVQPVPRGARPTPGSFQSGTLGDVGLWGVAATYPGLPALNSSLWRNADAGTVGVALERLQPNSRLPSMQALVRAALFSGGAAPAAGDDPASARLRFEAAGRFGPAPTAAELAAATPRLTDDPALARLATDLAFAVGRTGDACALAQQVGGPAAARTELYWMQARAVCYLVAREGPAADLATDLAVNAGLKDTWFLSAVAKANGASVPRPPAARYETGLDIQLSQLAGLTASREVIGKLTPFAASALLAREDAPVALKQAAAPRAVFAGVYAAQDWMRLLDGSTQEGDAWRAARLALQAAETQLPPDPVTGLSAPTDPAVKTAALARAAMVAKTVAERAAFGAAYASDIAAVAEVSETSLIEAALLAGDLRTAARLRAGLIIPSDPAAAARMVSLDAALAASGAPIDNPGAVGERRIDLGTGGDAAARASARDVLLMAAARVPVSSAARRAVFVRGLPKGERPSSAVMAALRDAAGRRAIGEVALLASLATQDLDPATIDAEAGAAVISALMDVGLERAGRELARDLILAARGLS